MAEDDAEREPFLDVEGIGPDGDSVVLSRSAFQLHSFASVNSVQEGRAGLVTDEYLSAISADSTTSALELCTAGVWERVDEGYRILDRATVEMALMAWERSKTWPSPAEVEQLGDADSRDD